MSGFDWTLAASTVGSWVSEHGGSWLAGIGTLSLAIVSVRQMGKERRERETLTDGEWDILKAIVQSYRQQPNTLTVFTDEDAFLEYLRHNYPLAALNNDDYFDQDSRPLAALTADKYPFYVKQHSRHYSRINAVPRKDPGPQKTAPGPVFDADQLVIRVDYSRYVTKLSERGYLDKTSDNGSNHSVSYTISTDGEQFIKNHIRRLHQPFTKIYTFFDVAEMLEIDHNIWHPLPPNAIVPEYVDTSRGQILGVEFPGVGEGSVPGIDYILEVPKQAVDIEELNRHFDGDNRRVYVSSSLYHHQWIAKREQPLLSQNLLYWREDRGWIHLWFEDGVGNTWARSRRSRDWKEEKRQQIETEFYQKDVLQLPTDSYYRELKNKLEDKWSYCVNRDWFSQEHPVIYRMLQHPLGNRLLERWIDRKIKKEDSSE